MIQGTSRHSSIIPTARHLPNLFTSTGNPEPFGTTEKIGRARQCRPGTERLEDAMSWIRLYQRLWERRLDGLDAYFTLKKENDQCPRTSRPLSCA